MEDARLRGVALSVANMHMPVDLCGRQKGGMHIWLPGELTVGRESERWPRQALAQHGNGCAPV